MLRQNENKVFIDTCSDPELTGKGSAPSWITKPSIRWVRIWDLTRAWAGLLSPLCWLLLVFPFPEVMTGATATPHLSTQAAWQTQQALTTWTRHPNSCCSNTQSMQWLEHGSLMLPNTLAYADSVTILYFDMQQVLVWRTTFAFGTNRI